MQAVRLHEEGLRLEELPVPEPGPGDVLVRVHAAAITRDELTWPTDRLPATPSHEISGVTVGGDEVYALTPFDRDGGAAEYVLVSRDVLAPKPPHLSHLEAAALPMGGLSAWQGLVVHGRLQPGERVCVTGGTGGVGRLALQLAESLGATLVAEGEPCDLLFDTAGRTEGEAGRVVTIAAEAPGATYFVVEPDRHQLVALTARELRPEVDSAYPLAEFAAAFERSAERGKHGKVVLDVASR